jgi:hypothetical protein
MSYSACQIGPILSYWFQMGQPTGTLQSTSSTETLNRNQDMRPCAVPKYRTSEMRILCTAAQQGPNVLFFMPVKTHSILLVSVILFNEPQSGSTA